MPVMSTGNDELDSRLGGGIPIPSLVLIEGGHGTGKSAMVQQLVYGALRSGLRTVVVTTEVRVREFVNQSRNISLDVTAFFLKGLLRIIPLHIEGAKWSERYSALLLPALSAYMAYAAERYDLFVVDSLSHVAMYARPSFVLDFLSRSRRLVSRGKTLIYAIHPDALRPDLMSRARALADVYFTLESSGMGGKRVKVLNVVKIKGAPTSVSSSVVFDVDPAFGIKVIPLTLAKA